MNSKLDPKFAYMSTRGTRKLEYVPRLTEPLPENQTAANFLTVQSAYKAFGKEIATESVPFQTSPDLYQLPASTSK